MYQPPHFIESDPATLHALIRAHPLGLLISSAPEGPIADPLPFLIDPDTPPRGKLRAHLSRANPHWRLISEKPGSSVLVVFQGVEGYVTPSWYETKRETGKVVPTWNYVMIQVKGSASIVDERDWIARQIADLTASQESSRPEPWRVTDAPEAFIEGQIRGIVGLEIEIAHIVGKWKVSQNRPSADRIGVAEGLEFSGSPEAGRMARLVRRFGGLPDA